MVKMHTHLFSSMNNSCIPIELPKILFIMIVKRSIETTEGISAVHRHPSNINLDMISALLLWRIGGRLESFSFCSVVCSIRSNLQYDKITRHVFLKHRCPGGNKTRIRQKSLKVLHFDPAPSPGASDVSEV